MGRSDEKRGNTMNRAAGYLEGERATKAGLFGLGWACADEAHLPALPQALATILRSPHVRMRISHPDGSALAEHAYQSEGTGDPLHTQELVETVPLGRALVLTITAGIPGGATPTLEETFHLAVSLMREALECIFVRQHDRHALGGSFPELSD